MTKKEVLIVCEVILQEHIPRGWIGFLKRRYQVCGISELDNWNTSQFLEDVRMWKKKGGLCFIDEADQPLWEREIRGWVKKMKGIARA